MMWGQGLFMLFFLIIVIVAVFWIVTMMSRQRRHHHPHEMMTTGDAATKPSEALRILDERFARGEIDAEEFTKRRELLRNPL